MKPNLSDYQLPPPPPGKTGWPWTLSAAAQENIRAALAASSDWPKISITTPSFNHGKYIEETIRSILLQGYPNLEYFVHDGGSQDETVSILKKYEPWLAGWISQKDRGQTDAINQGWRRHTGEIFAYLNSDDWYYPSALFTAAREFQQNSGAMWLCGQVDNFQVPEKILKRHAPRTTNLAELLGRKNYGYHQPGMFWRRQLVETVGPFDLELQYCFCPDFWARSLLAGFTPLNLQQPFAGFRLHPASKTVGSQHRFLEQDWIVFERYASKLSSGERKLAHRWLREYEASGLHDSVYALLANGRAAEARRFLLRRLALLLKVQPQKIVLGLLCRTFLTGKPPAWFRVEKKNVVPSERLSDG